MSVHDAIDEHLPDADDEEAMLDYDQVQTLYHQLVQGWGELQSLLYISISSVKFISFGKSFNNYKAKWFFLPEKLMAILVGCPCGGGGPFSSGHVFLLDENILNSFCF